MFEALVPGALSAPPAGSVTVGADGAQHLTPEYQGNVIVVMTQLYLIPGTPISIPLPQGATPAFLRGVRCDVWRQATNASPGTVCTPNANDYFNDLQRQGKIVLVDIENATTEQMDFIVTDRQDVAVAFAPPGSANAFLVPATERPAPGTIASRRKGMGAPLIAGAVGGALLGAAFGGAAGAVAGGLGGAIVGGVVGARA